MAHDLHRLYESLFREAGPSGRTLSMPDLDRDFPGSSVAFDRDVASRTNGSPSFRVDSRGQLTARMTSGGGNWEWTGSSWRHGAKHGPEAGKPVPQDHTAASAAGNELFDHFSRTEAEYRASLSAAATSIMGRGWSSLIDSAYGPGSSKRIIAELWRNLWSDHEGVSELAHYYDVAQGEAELKGIRRGTRDRRAWMDPESEDDVRSVIGSYPLRIGPRYDVPRSGSGDDDDVWSDRYVRRVRPSGPEFYDNIWSSG